MTTDSATSRSDAATMRDATQASTQDASIRAGDLLSPAVVATAPEGHPDRLRGGRGPRIVLRAHSSDCAQCRDYVASLIADGAAIRDWSARISVVVPDSVQEAAAMHTALDGRVQVFADARSQFALTEPLLAIADEWGEVYFATRFDADHALPDPAEVAEWAQFIVIQCPECEGPEGDWRTI